MNRRAVAGLALVVVLGMFASACEDAEMPEPHQIFRFEVDLAIVSFIVTAVVVLVVRATVRSLGTRSRTLIPSLAKEIRDAPEDTGEGEAAGAQEPTPPPAPSEPEPVAKPEVGKRVGVFSAIVVAFFAAFVLLAVFEAGHAALRRATEGEIGGTIISPESPDAPVDDTQVATAVLLPYNRKYYSENPHRIALQFPLHNQLYAFYMFNGVVLNELFVNYMQSYLASMEESAEEPAEVSAEEEPVDLDQKIERIRVVLAHATALVLMAIPAFFAARMRRRFWVIPLVVLIVNIVVNVVLWQAGYYETVSQMVLDPSAVLVDPGF